MPIPINQQTVRRKSAKELIFDTLKQWIIEGQLKQEEKINDSEIADFFSVSRTPVREAFQLLEQQKLIKSYPGKATLVTRIETENINQWYAPMQTLQQLGISMAVNTAIDSNFHELRTINSKFKLAIDTAAAPIEILNLDKDFHECILKIAHNPYILDFCDTLWIHIQRLEYAFFKENAVPIISYQDHENFIQALERKDQFMAEKLMKDHWDRTVLEITQLIRQKQL